MKMVELILMIGRVRNVLECSEVDLCLGDMNGRGGKRMKQRYMNEELENMKEWAIVFHVVMSRCL
jgi:hypothetical protein